MLTGMHAVLRNWPSLRRADGSALASRYLRPLLGVLIVAATQIFGGNLQADEPATAARTKKIVLIAGPITGHGKNTHEYEKNVILLKHLLDTSSNLAGVRTEVHFRGWPTDETTLDDADTIVMISDGGDRNEADHPLYVGNRLQVIEKQMRRGCGFLQFHWTTFNPSRFHDKVTEWVGGYFDYETGEGARRWFSAIKTWTGPVKLPAREHPITRGVKPFSLEEEFYYNIRFRADDARVTPIVVTRPPGESQDYPVGWAVERADGGRGFGFTGGHFYGNWWQADYRKLILNAIVWTAGADVPAGGVESQLDEPIRALILTGHNHPAHDWRKVTATLLPVIEQDPRVQVDVTENIEDLGNASIHDYDLLVMNYSNWDRPGLSDHAKANFIKYLQAGGGLSVIHYANGAFVYTIPNAESDWEEYRTKIVRRVWIHGEGKSGHDAYGPFRVEMTAVKHPITAGLADFETRDELYYRQMGDLPIVPLATAHSRDTAANEPMAWAYNYGKARVFQTVLGHGEESIRMAGALIRRGCVWAAGREQISFDPPTQLTEGTLYRAGSQWTPEESLKKAGLSQESQTSQLPIPSADKRLIAGHFGKALDARVGAGFASARNEYREPPLTVECWAKVDSRKGFNVLVASESKASATHWEMYSYAGSGVFSAYLPGMQPAEIKSSANICDGRWHYLAMLYEPERIRLFVDGKQVADQAVKFHGDAGTAGELALGSLASNRIGCDGLIDEVRISRGLREITSVPAEPLPVDERTVGLWRLDESNAEGTYRDQSSLQNHATAAAVGEKKK